MTKLRELSQLPPETRRNILRRVVQMLIFDSLIALFLFVSAGSVKWLYAWLYTAFMVVIQLVGGFFLPPEVLAERGSKKENTEKWDRVLTRWLIPCFLSIYLVSGLDFRRHWSAEFSSALHYGAVILFLLGCVLELWAMYANRFFSTDVRLQFDRGHAVCSHGPYKYVRHPGYAGMILYYGITPIFLGSFWALIPVSLVVALFVIRSWFEDRTLKDKLSGYKEYAHRVRYRLIPGIW